MVLAIAASAGAADWHVPGDFATIQAANDSASVAAGDTVFVGPGDHAGALLSKSITIKGTGGARITSGPVHGSGLIQGFRLLVGSDGATLSHLTFTTDLSIMNADAIDAVTVTQCTFLNSVQAISNWRGSGWEITHNVITDLRTQCGGGIGILIADYAGGVVWDNIVSHNKISGTLHVSEGDCGGYSGTGIVLYADFRWGGAGAEEIAYNRVVKNKVSLVSDNEEVVGAVGFELTDTRNIDASVVFANQIGFNDFRGSTTEQAYSEGLLDGNVVSRNFGNNRGHGLHPSMLFEPGH